MNDVATLPLFGETIVGQSQPSSASQPFQLRPYQTECVETLIKAYQKDRRILCVLPTGSGKTEIFREIVEKIRAKTCILVNRDKLVEQTARRFRHLNPSVYSAGQGSKEISDLTVASVQSIRKISESFDFIICDEAHNIGEAGSMYDTFLSNSPNAIVMGFTATPYRNGEYIYGPGSFFQQINFKRSMEYMIDNGFLVKPMSKNPEHLAFDTSGLRVRMGDYLQEELEALTSDEKKVQRQVVDAIIRLEGRRKIVWICTSIKHAELVRKLIPEDSCITHSKLKDTDYQLHVFENSDQYRHMVSVMMLTEGYDYPPIDAIVLMRPTKSAKLYVQVVGRGLRPSTDKKDCLVLDYGEVIKNLGPVTDPILISSSKKTKTAVELEKIKLCKKCFSMFDPKLVACPDCGFEEEKPKPNLKQRAETERDILGKDVSPEDGGHIVKNVFLSQHVGRSSGKKCIKVTYEVGLIGQFHEYFSDHSFSWGRGRFRLQQLTSQKIESFHEAFEHIDEISESWIQNIPGNITVKKERGFDTITTYNWKERARDRTRDTSVSNESEHRVLLEEHNGRVL